MGAQAARSEHLQREADMPGTLPEEQQRVLFVDTPLGAAVDMGGTTPLAFATVDPRGATFRILAST
jgi:hypothetical protein